MNPGWRINGYSSQDYKYYIRIGEFYNDCNWGSIGEDKNGNACSAKFAGFGIKDDEWP